MQDKLPTIAATFDRSQVDQTEAWRVIWKAVGPDQIPGALFYEGPADDRRYCVCVQAEDPAVVEEFRAHLAHEPSFKEVAASVPFIEGDDCLKLDLHHAGRIDSHGRLVGDAKNARPALAAVRVIHEPSATAEPVTAERPRSERTANLPPILGFVQLKEFVRATFAPPEEANAPRELWITPSELADLVEAFSWFLEVRVSEHVAPNSESVLHVRLFDKQRHEIEPLHLAGLFAFSSRTDVTAFLASFSTNPTFADMLPDLAGLAGRFQLNFGRYFESGRKLSFDRETAIDPPALWPLLASRQGKFGEELRKAIGQVERNKEAAARLREAQQAEQERLLALERESADRAAEERERRRTAERESQARAQEAQRAAVEAELNEMDRRRAAGACVFCGKPLGIKERLKKADRHKDCWRFVSAER